MSDSAFPTHEVWDDEKTDIGWIGGGLTKRELFAAMAMEGLMAGGSGSIIGSLIAKEAHRGANGQVVDLVVGYATKAADALLAELAKEKSE